jgi:hypothetical protein
LLVGLLGGSWPFAGPVRAATLVVATTADSGAGSLRQAIADAAAGDTIIFDPALAGQAITLTSGQLQISKDLTISGPGAEQLAVRRSDAAGTPAFRIFDIKAASDATVGPVVTITGLTIANGDATPIEIGTGAGVRLASGTLTLGEVVVTDNLAANYAGVYATVATDTPAGIGSTLTVRNSTISGNTATNLVGGLMVGFQASATVVGSTISGNSGITGYGGVYVQGQGGAAGTNSTITIANSTISGNVSDLGGGLIVRNNGNATVTNSTISGNSALSSAASGPPWAGVSP